MVKELCFFQMDNFIEGTLKMIFHMVMEFIKEKMEASLKVIGS